MFKKLKFGALAGVLVIAGMIVIAGPASASTPVCTGATVNYSFPVKNIGGSDIAYRGGCAGFVVNYLPGGNYYFSVNVQDWNDVSAQVFYDNDDLGFTRLQYQTPGSTVWIDWTTDTWSGDFTRAFGTTATYNSITNGPAADWNWRLVFTTHYRCNSHVLCGLGTNWKTLVDAQPYFKVW